MSSGSGLWSLLAGVIGRGNATMGHRRSSKILVWTCLVLLLTMSLPSFAQEAPPEGAALPEGFAMDLSSTEASMAAQNAQPVNIYTEGALGANGAITGGVAQTVNPGQMVTPAQYMAISQIMSGLEQTLVLSAAGAAAAGFASVSPATMSVLESLHIPVGVSLNSIGFNAASAFNVAGAATVNGALYAIQQNQAATAVLNLGSLLVGPGAMLTTNLPSYSAMLGNVLASSGLTMNIAGSMTNYGTIATSGPLSVLAGGAIYNQTLAGMPQASMVAQSVAMSSLASTIVNSGIITALSGNISMASQLASNLSVLNSGGVLQALNGSINFRSQDFTGKFHLDVLGGDLLAQQINMYSGDGVVNLYANDVTGRVNITAGEAHVTAATNNLVLGNLNLSGDPTFYNLNPLGDVTIDGDLNFSGQDLAIVANRNVVTSTNAGSINTSSTTGKGGSVTIVAGANFSASYTPSGSAPASWPTSGVIVNPATPIFNDQDLVLQITGPSNNGGKIDLVTGGAISTFSTKSTAPYPGNAAGGNVTLVAFQGSSSPDPNAGTIKLPINLTITTGGGITQPPSGPDVVFPSGNFLAIAGGPSTGANPAIVIGSVDTSNTIMQYAVSASPGGSVLVHAATPILMGASPVFIQGGTVMSGSFVPDTAQYHNASVEIKNIWATGAVQVVSGGSVGVFGMLSTLPNFALSGFPTDILLAAGVGPGVNAATLSIGDVLTNGNSLSLLSSANIVSASGHSSLIISTFDDLSTLHTPMGTINLLAGVMAMPNSALVLGIPQLVQVGVPGPSPFAGAINFAVPTTFVSGPSYNVQPGGNLTMLSYNGTVNLNAGSAINSNGGSIVVLAGSTTNQHFPNCSICLGSINAGSGSIFVATEQPVLTGPGLVGPISVNIGIGNVNPTTAVPVLKSSISFGGSLSAGNFLTVLAGLDISFPNVSSITSSGQKVTLAAGINQDPGSVLPAPLEPVYPGALMLGSTNLTDISITASGLNPLITLVAGVDLTVPGVVIANNGSLNLIVNGDVTALPTQVDNLQFDSTGGTVTVHNTGSPLAISADSSATSVTISNDNDIVVSHEINAIQGINLSTTANNGDIILEDDLTFGSSSTAQLSTNGAGFINQVGGTVSGGSLALSTGGGSVGPLQTSVLSLTANIGGFGSLVVNNFGTTSLGLGPVFARTIFITNDADICVTGTVGTTGSVTLATTSGSEGDIILDAPVGDLGQLVAIVTLTSDGGILNGASSPIISGRTVNLTSAAEIIGTPLSHLQVTANFLTATPFPPGTTNVDWFCCLPAPTPAPETVRESEIENTLIADLVTAQEESSAANNSIVNGDGSPAITPTDATPQSHEVPIDLTNATTTNLNLGAETSEQMHMGIPGAAASGNTTVAELQNQGVQIGAGSTEAYVILNQGNVLFQPNHDMTVQVQEGHVFIPDGAVAFVIETGHDVAVFDMHDGKKGPVRVRAGKQMITLSPGKQLVLTRQLEADFDAINPEKLIAHRNVKTVATSEGIRIYSADFSLPSMMMNVSPIKRMLASDNPAERRQARKLLKNAVVLAQLSGQKGPYNNSGSNH